MARSRQRNIEYIRKTGKWRGRFKHKGEYVHCGMHDTEQAASEAVQRIREQIKGPKYPARFCVECGVQIRPQSHPASAYPHGTKTHGGGEMCTACYTAANKANERLATHQPDESAVPFRETLASLHEWIAARNHRIAAQNAREQRLNQVFRRRAA